MVTLIHSWASYSGNISKIYSLLQNGNIHETHLIFFSQNIQRTESKKTEANNNDFFMSRYIYFPYILLAIVPIINYLNNTDKEK